MSVLIAVLATSVLSAAGGSPGRIAFASNRDGNFNIYVMEPDGSGLRALTRHSAEDRDPAWSPDGRRIAFISRRDGNSEIYVVNVDGSGERRLTDSAANDFGPSWAPDGRRIAFVSDRFGGNADLYVINADGSGLRRLTTEAADDWLPTWSPDGRRILFVSGRQAVNSDGAGEMYFVPSSGGPAAQVLTAARKVLWAALTPDGRRVAFSMTGNRRQEIAVVSADGSSEKNLSEAAGTSGDSQPAWSPDGRRLTFLGDRDATGVIGVFVATSDGADVRRVSAPGQSVSGPVSWAGDSEHLVYSGFFQSNWNIYTANVRGERRQLTNTKSMDLGATWAPR